MLFVMVPRAAAVGAQHSAVALQALFAKYRGEDAIDAVRQLAVWSPADLEATIAEVPLVDARAEAAFALFLTESGLQNGEFGGELLGSRGRIIREVRSTTAGRLVDEIAGSSASSIALQEFCVEWYVLRGSVFSRWNRGIPEVSEHFRHRPEIALMMGAWFEKRMGPERLGGRGVWYSPEGLNDSMSSPASYTSTSHGLFSTAMVRQAQADLRDASSAPELTAEAHLRLGHIAMLLDRRPEAQEELGNVDRRGEDSFVTYLDLLFAARLAEEQKRPEVAAIAYEDALRINPAAPSALLGLGALRLSQHRDAEGWASLGSAASFEGGSSVADPWQLYPDGAFRRAPSLVYRLRELVR